MKYLEVLKACRSDYLPLLQITLGSLCRWFWLRDRSHISRDKQRQRQTNCDSDWTNYLATEKTLCINNPEWYSFCMHSFIKFTCTFKHISLSTYSTHTHNYAESFQIFRLAFSLKNCKTGFLLRNIKESETKEYSEQKFLIRIAKNLSYGKELILFWTHIF